MAMRKELVADLPPAAEALKMGLEALQEAAADAGEQKSYLAVLAIHFGLGCGALSEQGMEVLLDSVRAMARAERAGYEAYDEALAEGKSQDVAAALADKARHQINTEELRKRGFDA